MNLILSEVAAEVAKNYENLKDKKQYNQAVKTLQGKTGLNRNKCRTAINKHRN